MTTYTNQQAYLEAELQSTMVALEYIRSELQKIQIDMDEDFSNTKDKIVGVYERGVYYLLEQEHKLSQELSRVK